MNNEQWEVRINNFEHTFNSQVFIYRFVGKTIQYLEIKSPEVIVHSEQYEYGSAQTIKPTLVCPQDEALNIAKGFVAYANSQGFKNGSETFVKGKLEATEKHLDDMRNLVFKNHE